MAVKQDYIMRLIEQMVQGLKLIAGKNQEDIRPGEALALTDDREHVSDLAEMIVNGDINEAENILWEAADGTDMRTFRIGLYFYEHLNTFPNEFLEEHNFSREEIQEGLLHLAEVYGVKDIAEVLLK